MIWAYISSVLYVIYLSVKVLYKLYNVISSYTKYNNSTDEIYLMIWAYISSVLYVIYLSVKVLYKLYNVISSYIKEV